MVELAGESDPPELKAGVAEKYYKDLRQSSLMSLLFNSIPALVFTVAAIWLYVSVEIHNPFIGQFYDSASNFILLACIVASVLCWGLFFWIQVRNSQLRAKLWRESLESYEALIESESQFSSEEEKKEAARIQLKAAQEEFGN